MKKALVRGVIVFFILVFLVLTGLYFYGLYLPEINRYFAQKEETAILAKMEAEKQAFLELHKKDIEGGVTPEETFDLLISALKAGNIDLASKYYVPIYQEGAKESFAEEIKKNGGLENSIKHFSLVRKNGIKTCLDIAGDIGGCSFEYEYITTEDQLVGMSGRPEKFLIPKGGVRTKVVSFWLNPYTKKWKVKSQP